MTTTLSGKTALITGGGSGIGRATAQAFAREGAIVVVAGRNAESLEETVRLIKEEHGQAYAVVADVTRADDVRAMVDAASQHGGLHIAVNNAGVVGRPAPVADLDEDTWSTVFATNTTGVWLSMKYQIAHMLNNGGGAIVNVASTVGAHITIPSMAAYAASKAAVSSLTRTAAKEYIGHGIRINAISPGPIDTSMSLLPGETDVERAARLSGALPAGRVGSLDEAAGTILWLTSPASGFVVGHDLVIDGGAAA